MADQRAGYRRIGINTNAAGVTVRGVRHFTECIVAMWPDSHDTDECTCWDDSPDV